MRFKHVAASLWMLVYSFIAYSQHQDISEKPAIWKGNNQKPQDTTSLLHAFKSGHTKGHFRYFFMATDNQPGLDDYYANAVGGGIRFETEKYHGFQFAVSGFYTFNIGSSDFTKSDSVTNQFNRYEIALFDVANPKNYKDIDRLEELYLKYNYNQSYIRFGRQLINTPFINLQDGRMRPTGVEGLWLEFNEVKNLKLEGGYIYAISPRGTTQWYYMGESVGLYPSGFGTNGSPSNYAHNIRSQGVGLMGVQVSPAKWIDIKLWDLYFSNVQNTAMIQTDFKKQLGEKSSVTGGLQFIRQDAINHGGNEDQTRTYVNKGAKAITYGARIGWKNRYWELTMNYNRITSQGRYLMPREWGRDPFFTFLPRERNDGLGDVDAVMAKVEYNVPKTRLKTSAALGSYKLPDVKNFAMNKYGLPSYIQINGDIRYAFNGYLKGLEAQLLLVGKIKNGETYSNKRFEFNKVNMVLYNLVLNYHF